MAESDAIQLFTKDDTGEMVEYTPPEPLAFSETLPEDIRESEHLTGVEDNAQLAKAYVDLKSNIPTAPENPEGYEFNKPDGYDLDTDTFSEFRKSAHENGITQKQFDFIMKVDTERHAKAKETIETSIATAKANAEKELKTEWGDNYDRKVKSATDFLKHPKLASEGFSKFLEDTRFGDNPQVVRFFARLAETISEDSFQQPGTGDRSPGPRVGEDGRPMLSFPSME